MGLFNEPYPKKLLLTVNNLRKKMISDISYDLTLKIDKGENYAGEVRINFTRTHSLPDTDLVFDFKGKVDSCAVNGVSMDYD